MRLASEFRTQALDERRAFLERTPPQVLTEISQILADHFFKAIAGDFFSGQKVALTRPRRDEINLNPIIDGLRQRGARLYFPKVKDEKSGTLEFFEVLDPHTHSWTRGAFGIEEPSSGERLDPLQLNWVLVPGAAFGKKGERIGLGRGFFDRYLARAPQAVRVAICLEFQVFESLPQENWDLPVDWIVTPRGALKVKVRK